MREEIQRGNADHTNVEPLPEDAHLDISLELDSPFESVRPRVKLEYLDIVEALRGRVQPLVLALHVPLLQTRTYLCQHDVDGEGDHENGHARKEGHAQVAEQKYETNYDD